MVGDGGVWWMRWWWWSKCVLGMYLVLTLVHPAVIPFTLSAYHHSQILSSCQSTQSPVPELSLPLVASLSKSRGKKEEV